MIYLDRNGLSPNCSDTYIAAIGAAYDSDQLPNRFAVNDTLITGPFTDWSWLPNWVNIRILPDNTEVKRSSPIAYALRQAKLPASYKSKPPAETNKNYDRYQEAMEWARQHSFLSVVVGEADFPYAEVTDGQEARELFLRLHDFAFDFETLPNGQIDSVQVATEKMAWYIRDDGLRALPILREVISRQRGTVVAHGAKFEYKVVAQNSLGTFEPTECTPWHDTMIMNWVYTSQNFGNDLKSMTERYLKRSVLRFEDVAPDKNIGNTPLPLRIRYAVADPRNTFDLYRYLEPKLKEHNLWYVYNEIDKPLVPVLAEMEMTGMNIDRQELERITLIWQEQEKAYAGSLRELGYNGSITSADQIAEWFYTKIGLPIMAKTASGKRGAVDEKTLLLIYDQHPAIPVYLAWSEANKLLSTFLLPLQESNSSAVTYNLMQTSTKTGRLSCTDPNMQQIPVSIRSLFVPPPASEFHDPDFSRIEPRIAAVASGDEKMLKDFRNDVDIYVELGKAMGMTNYRLVKSIYLGSMYGAMAFKIQEQALRDGLHISVGDAAKSLDALRQAKPDFFRWREHVIQQTRETGESRSLYGRRRIMSDVYSSNPLIREAAEREAVNMVIQGTAADICKIAMLKVRPMIREAGGRLHMQVHDELLYSLPIGYDSQAAQINEEMARNDLVPLAVKSKKGSNWLEAH